MPAIDSVDHQLRTLLDADPPDSVSTLDESARAELVEIITAAKERQKASLAEAFEATLRHVPFPARKLARKMLLG